MNVHVLETTGDHVVLAVTESPDGVNPPATLMLSAWRVAPGTFSVTVIGGHDEEDPDVDKPTIADGTYNGDRRVWTPA
jgi:hypothetical protein